MQWYYLDAQRQQVQSDEAGIRQLFADGALKKDSLVWNETLTEWMPLEKALPQLAAGSASPAPVSPKPSFSAPGPVATGTGVASSTAVASSPVAPSSGTLSPQASAANHPLNPYAAPASATSVAPHASPIALATTPSSSGGSGNIREFAAILAQNAGWSKFIGVVMIIVGVISCLTIIGAIIGWLYIWIGLICTRIARLSREAQASGSPHTFTETMESISRLTKILGIALLVYLLLLPVLIALQFAALAASGGLSTPAG